MKKVNISHVNNQHNYWLRSLTFYKTELNILKGILTEIAGKNSAHEMMKDVEHFENQFRLQTENIDRLSRNIHNNIDTIGRQAQQSSAGFIDGTLLTDHTALGEDFLAQEVILKELIHAFRFFAERWM